MEECWLSLKKKKGRMTAAAHLFPPSSPHAHIGALLHYNIHTYHNSWQGDERHVSEGTDHIPPSLLYPASRKDSNQHLGRYKGKDKGEKGRGKRMVVLNPSCCWQAVVHPRSGEIMEWEGQQLWGMELGFQTPFPEMHIHLTWHHYWVKNKHRNENLGSPSSQENTLTTKL